mgnify:CR=1 FL=1|tara:strand:- start:479 stop:736 length:258 start_codon:yes stop_codon:yes gene_type:complete
MTLNFETTHEYYIKDASVLWCKEHDGLVITKSWEDQVRITGINEEIIISFIRGLFKNYPELAAQFKQETKKNSKTSSLKAVKETA